MANVPASKWNCLEMTMTKMKGRWSTRHGVTTTDIGIRLVSLKRESLPWQTSSAMNCQLGHFLSCSFPWCSISAECGEAELASAQSQSVAWWISCDLCACTEIGGFDAQAWTAPCQVMNETCGPRLQWSAYWFSGIKICCSISPNSLNIISKHMCFVDWWLPLLWYKQGKCQQTYLYVTILFYERYFIHLPGVFLSHKACSFFHKVAIFISPSLLF